jgi:transposase
LRMYFGRGALGCPVSGGKAGRRAGAGEKVVHRRGALREFLAGKAKLMLGAQNKTDRLDCRGLIRLQRAGTLPVVWVPPRELRDIRELVRARMVLVRQRTQLKNRILATLGKYGLVVEGVSDAFGVRGRQVIAVEGES